MRITPGAVVTEVKVGEVNIIVALGDLLYGDSRVVAGVQRGGSGFINPGDTP
jgi:hypothetical protein